MNCISCDLAETVRQREFKEWPEAQSFETPMNILASCELGNGDATIFDVGEDAVVVSPTPSAFD